MMTRTAMAHVSADPAGHHRNYGTHGNHAIRTRATAGHAPPPDTRHRRTRATAGRAPPPAAADTLAAGTGQPTRTRAAATNRRRHGTCAAYWPVEAPAVVEVTLNDRTISSKM